MNENKKRDVSNILKHNPRPQPGLVPTFETLLKNSGQRSESSRATATPSGQKIRAGKERSKNGAGDLAMISEGPSRSQATPQAIPPKHVDPFSDLRILGTFVQEETYWTLCTSRALPESLMLMQRTDESSADYQRKLLARINHRNIIRLERAYFYGGRAFLAFEHCRFTLREILHVHLGLRERHIQVIAHSVRMAS